MTGKLVSRGGGLADTVSGDEGALLTCRSCSKELKVLRIEVTSKWALRREEAVEPLPGQARLQARLKRLPLLGAQR